jgi:hypothetical protein
MSSVYVRDQVITFLEASAPTEVFIDLSGQFSDIEDLVIDAGITMSDPWVGIQFLGSDEEPVSVPATNAVGKYREYGSIYIHVVGVAVLGESVNILTRAETLRDALRGQRINDVVIQSVTPANFGLGATISFEAGYTSASFIVNYERDLNL